MNERRPKPPLIDPDHTRRTNLFLGLGCFTVVVIGCLGLPIWFFAYGRHVRPEEEARVAEEIRFMNSIPEELDKSRMDLRPDARIAGTVQIIEDKRKLGEKGVSRTRFLDWIPEHKLSNPPRDTEYFVWIHYDTELAAKVFLCERKTGRLLATTDFVSRWNTWSEPSRKWRNKMVERKSLVVPEKELRQWFDGLLK